MEHAVTHACLVHPHPLECEAVAEWLRKKSYIELVGKCASLEQFALLSYLRDIDMVLVFAHHTGQVAEQVLKIRKQNSRIRFLLLAPGASAESIREVVRSGVSGYIVPEAELDEWERSVRAVAEGKVYYGQEIMLKLAETAPDDMGNDPNRSKKDFLSKREVEILRLVASEYSTNRIANELCISDKTVETHRRNLFQKLGVKNAVGLTKAAVRMGVV
ncbi:response regulator transcription factor [Dyadobacter sandarakinus]|uniref:Response regulator transcription factor n=1 Tax=Dyadobacter sandarakinus TaxID=2747268 RepID=A0ABX7ID12_9BACT|nr:response regulator transcription factor [Dyadobacter sandarakinus]QRR03003.1 response regulator transcription factor [Dyadobacter sandarakinus]